MNSIWKVGAAAVTVALLGGFYLGRVASDSGPLPAVGQPVTVGSTVEPTPSVAETPTLHPVPSPSHSKNTPDGTEATETPDDGPTHDLNDDNGGNSGKGGGSDDGIVGFPTSVMTFDDHGGNSGPGGGGDDGGGDDH